MKCGVGFLVSLWAGLLTGIGFGEGAAGALSWNREEASLALLNGDRIVWRLVYDPALPKSHFHPLATIDGRVMTAFQPADHPWHRGLWWSWKYINGVNYWEENPKTGKSEGLTKLVRTDVEAADDFSARIAMDLQYHPPGQKPVLAEKRRIAVSRPDADGAYVIDWRSEFTAADQPLKLDRTVPAHLGGVSYGGYAGLSLRMAKGLDGYAFRTSEGAGEAARSHGKPARWVDLSGADSGIVMFDHPANPRHPAPWYLHSSEAMLFFAPAHLFNEPLELAPGESVCYTHRVIVHSKQLAPETIEERWRAFAQPQSAKP